MHYSDNVECNLQDISSVVATPKSSAREAHLKRVQFSARHIEELEEWIDEYTEQLPELTNFILPVSNHKYSRLNFRL